MHPIDWRTVIVGSMMGVALVGCSSAPRSPSTAAPAHSSDPDARAFTGYTFLTNLWDVGAKLLLPVVAVIALARSGDVVVASLRTASLLAGVGFLGLVGAAALLLLNAGLTDLVARHLERALGAPFADGYRSEVLPQLPYWMQAVTASLEAGVVLFVDYGYPRAEYYLPARNDGTLVCHYRHRAHADPLH